MSAVTPVPCQLPLKGKEEAQMCVCECEPVRTVLAPYTHIQALMRI